MAVLTLDDRDPSIVYSTSPAWSQDGVAVEYNSTTTFANQPRMTAQMKFRGESQLISVDKSFINYALEKEPVWRFMVPLALEVVAQSHQFQSTESITVPSRHLRPSRRANHNLASYSSNPKPSTMVPTPFRS